MPNGEKIVCSEADESVKAIQGVKDGAVLLADEFLTAVVVAEESDLSHITEQIRSLNRQTSYQRRITRLLLRKKELPYTSMGKLERNRLEKEVSLCDAGEFVKIGI